MNDSEFLKVIEAEPANPVPRLVYADWLDEQGDPRGDLLRVTVEAANQYHDCRARHRAFQEIFPMVRFSILLFILILIACPWPLASAEPLVLDSPDGRLRLSVSFGEEGEPAFQVDYGDLPLASGVLGVEFADSGRLGNNLKIVGVRRNQAPSTKRKKGTRFLH